MSNNESRSQASGQLSSVDLFLKRISEGGNRLSPCTREDIAEVHELLEPIRQAEFRRAVELRGELYTG